MPNLLFIGTPQDAIPAMARAIGLGYGIFAIDGDKSSEGLAWVKKWGTGADQADCYDFHWIHKTVLKNGWQVDGVIAVGTDVSPVCSLVSKAIGCFSIPYGITRLSWDKPALKKVLSQAGIQTPATADFVIKPPDSRGSRGVSIVSASNLWGAEWEAAKQNSPTGRVMCEEWIGGDGISIETLVWDKEIIFTGACDRFYSRSKTVEHGGHSPSCKLYPSGSWVYSLSKQVIQAIGLVRGSVKIDAILKDGDIRQPYVIEAAIGRLGGGRNGDMFLTLGYNVDFLAMAFAIYCGQDPRPILDKKPLKSRLAQNGYHVVSQYEMNGQPVSNKERGQVFFGLGKTKEEAEKKAKNWLKRRNEVEKELADV